MIGCDWLNALEEMLVQSYRATELTADCVRRLLIMGRACGSIYFIFMSQMVHVVLFMNKLDVQNTSVSKAVCRMHRASWTKLSLETLPHSLCLMPTFKLSFLFIPDPGAVFPVQMSYRGSICTTCFLVHNSRLLSLQQFPLSTSSGESKTVFYRKKINIYVYCTRGWELTCL